MTPELGRELAGSVDAAIQSFTDTGAKLLSACSLCSAEILSDRAPYYATIWTEQGTLYFPVCTMCVARGIQEGNAALKKWLWMTKNRRAIAAE